MHQHEATSHSLIPHICWVWGWIIIYMQGDSVAYGWLDSGRATFKYLLIFKIPSHLSAEEDVFGLFGLLWKETQIWPEVTPVTLKSLQDNCLCLERMFPLKLCERWWTPECQWAQRGCQRFSSSVFIPPLSYSKEFAFKCQSTIEIKHICSGCDKDATKAGLEACQNITNSFEKAQYSPTCRVFRFG